MGGDIEGLIAIGAPEDEYDPEARDIYTAGSYVSDARKRRAFEAENAKLKRLVADLHLDIVLLKDVNSKKW